MSDNLHHWLASAGEEGKNDDGGEANDQGVVGATGNPQVVDRLPNNEETKEEVKEMGEMGSHPLDHHQQLQTEGSSWASSPRPDKNSLCGNLPECDRQRANVELDDDEVQVVAPKHDSFSAAPRAAEFAADDDRPVQQAATPLRVPNHELFIEAFNGPAASGPVDRMQPTAPFAMNHDLFALQEELPAEPRAQESSHPPEPDPDQHASDICDRQQANMELDGDEVQVVAPPPVADAAPLVAEAAVEARQKKTANEYEVTITPDPEYGLGLRLLSQADGMCAVAGSFKRHPLNGEVLPAEKCGAIRLGDELLCANDVDLEYKSFADVVVAVREVGSAGCRGSPIRMKFRRSPARDELQSNEVQVIERVDNPVRQGPALLRVPNNEIFLKTSSRPAASGFVDSLQPTQCQPLNAPFAMRHTLFATQEQLATELKTEESSHLSDQRSPGIRDQQQTNMELDDDEVQVVMTRSVANEERRVAIATIQALLKVNANSEVQAIELVEDDEILSTGDKPVDGSCGSEHLDNREEKATKEKEVTPAPYESDQTMSEEMGVSKEWRRRRRRRLRRLCNKSKGDPSFVALLSANYDISDDEIETEEVVQLELEQLPKRIRIDLDAELGLKDAKPTLFIKREKDDTVYQQDFSSSALGDLRPAPTQFRPKNDPSPVDEGWYEGTAPVHLPEDAEYLTKIQQWVRKNFEFFSATSSATTAGRSTPTARCRVGLRCIHCARAASLSPSNLEGTGQPSGGAIVYPVSISGLPSIFSQKLQPHLEECPNLPDYGKMQLLSLLEESPDSAIQPRTPRRSEGGLSTTIYCIISAKRIGLVDVKDGIRFGRDLELEPLPFATVRSRVENETAGSPFPTLSRDMEGDALGAAEPRIRADSDSEAVLAEAVAEADDQPGNLALSRVEDKSLVTDYLFLVIRQLAICHAGSLDFASRGKKTKMLRVGFAGYCCRWCQGGDDQPDWSPADSSCRSFASSAEALSSIASSFTPHLQKCYKVPVRIKKALLAYKRIHQRQMAQLPYGSHRRLYRLIWARLRASDKSEEKMLNEIPERTSGPYSISSPSTAKRQSATGAAQQGSDDESYQRPSNFPIVEDAETNAALHDAETNWDPGSNDHLFLPSDRHLVSDYVFLAMRQLRMVFPDELDVQRARCLQSALPGLACKHCLDKEQANISQSGRSFLSAPDNFASALNTSLYKHMQACAHVPEHLKRALANTRIVHSAQCASNKFGSQRMYFNLLFDRLKRAKGSPGVIDLSVAQIANNQTAESFLDKYGFMEVPVKDKSKAIYICKQCRMVPIQFRARDSTFLGMPRSDLVRQHSSRCKKSCLDLEVVTDALDEILRSDYGDDRSLLDRDTFKTMIRTAVIDETLAAVFTDDVRKLLLQRRSGEAAMELDYAESNRRKDLWNAFPSSVRFSDVESAFRAFAHEVCDMSEHLREHPALIQYLLLISPSLVVPDKEQEAS